MSFISMPKLIDTHAHVNFSAFKADAEKVLQNCLTQDTWVINIGSQYETSKRAAELARKYEQGIYAVVGLHPLHLFSQHIHIDEEINFESRQEEFDYQKYKKLASDPKVVGIGECGLEYYELPEVREEEIKAKQKDTFLEQIKLASELNKVLMVHSRDTYEEIYEVLKPLADKLTGIVVHSFIGNWEQAEKFVKLGCYIGYNGIVTFKPRKEKKPGQSDPKLLEAVEKTPLGNILLETDCPYLSPEPLRGKRNLPVNVKIIAQKVADIKGVSVDEVEEATTNNAKKLFKI